MSHEARLLGKRLRRHREKLDLSQMQIASLAGVPCCLVSRVERGIKVRPATQRKIERALKRARPRMSGADVRAKREELGWTQRELADFAGTTPGTISLIERGVFRMTPATLSAIETALTAFETVEAATPFAKTLRDAMTLKGLDQKSVAARARMTEPTVHHALNGGRQSPGTRQKLMAAIQRCPDLVAVDKWKQLRTILRLTPDDLAKQARVDERTIRNAESDRFCPRAAVRARVHRAFEQLSGNRPLEELLSSPPPSLPGDEIRRRREAMGLTQEQLARRIGIADDNTISRIELGEQQPRMRTLAAIEHALANLGGNKGRRLYKSPRSAAPAQNGQPSNGSRLEPLLSEPSAQSLSESQYEFLDALFNVKAFSGAMRATVKEVSEKVDRNAGTMLRVASQLKKLRLVDSQEGRGGGCWLTANGKATVEAARR